MYIFRKLGVGISEGRINRFLIRILLVSVFGTLSYSGNDCPKWFPLPSNDSVVVIPIYPTNITEADLDCDGVIDTKDKDIDGDGVPNTRDAFPRNASESIDTDGDGVGNNADSDDDNDGYSDTEEIAAGSDPLNADDIPIDDTPLKRIFILGSSTVHAEWYRGANFGDPYGENRVLEGWGEELTQYAKDPSKVYNRARSGSHSIRYRSPDDSRPGRADRHWENTEALIVDTNDSHGGFLLIQFGAAEAYSGVSVEDFKTELRAYVSDAKRLGLTPVLISPIGARSHSANTRPYAEHVEAVANETGTLFLDLYTKSKAVWKTFEVSENGHLTQADKYFSYIQRDRSINNTHLGRIGAKEVAGWVKALACTSLHVDGIALCQQFVEDTSMHAMTMREDAEDADTQYWETYGTTTDATVSNVYDAQKRSNVIVLQGDAGLDNGFRYSRENLWDTEDEPVISWEMSYNEEFTFFVNVDTEDGYKTFEYRPNDKAPQIVSGRYRFGLGSDASDGTWHTFVRDLEKDLQMLEPNKHILMVHRIAIRGSGRVDNIKTMKSVDALSHDIAPTVAVLGEAEVTISMGSDYVDAGVTVVDDIDTHIEAQLVTTGTVDTSTEGTYTLYYRVHDSVGNGGYAKRVVHVVDEAEEEVATHEDAEDGKTTGWKLYATTNGSTISNVVENGNHVIELQGNNGLDNGFSFSGLNITEGFVTSWRLKYSNDFRFFVQVRSINSPDKNIYMEYTPDAVSRGLNGSFIHHGLGTDAKDGTWHTFTRDVGADFNKVYPDDNVTRIVGFSIRGSGRIDDISTSASMNNLPLSLKTTKSNYNSSETVSISIADGGSLSGDQDWVGVFKVSDNNEWGNVVAWNWVGEGTTELSRNQKSMPAGEYEIRLFFHNEYGADVVARATYGFAVTDDTYAYGKMGKYDVEVSAYSGDDHAVVYHPTTWGVAPTPVLFFTPGWHNTTHASYRTLLRFIASHGYSVIYMPDEKSYHRQAEMFDSIVSQFATKLNTKKIGILGHSSGGGATYYMLEHMIAKDYGAEGRFLMSLDGYFACEMDRANMQALGHTNVLFMQFGPSGNSTDPRVVLTNYKLLTGEGIDKNYIVLPNDNDHGYPTRQELATMQGMLKPLDALMEYTFAEQSSAHHAIALEGEGKIDPYANGHQQVLTIDSYKYDCHYANKYHKGADGHTQSTIDNCGVPEIAANDNQVNLYPADTTFDYKATVDVAQPSYLAGYTDPLFHSEVTRITDMNTQTYNMHTYPKQGSAWNYDMTILKLGYRLYDAQTFAELSVTKGLNGSKAYSKLGSPYQGAADMRWSKIDPNKIFVLDSSQRFQEVIIDANRTDTSKHLLIDLSGLGYEKITTGANEGNVDYHDTHVLFVAKKEGDDTAYALLYKIGKTTLEWEKPLKRGAWADGLDWMSVDAKGRHIVVSSQGKIYAYDMHFENERLVESFAEHGDLGIDVNGNSVYVQLQSGGRGVWLYDLDHDVAPKKMLDSNHGGGHISCRNYKRPGWCYISMAEEGYKEVFALKLDNATGTVERFAQTHGGEKNTGCTQVNVSPDGTKVLFASSWDLGSEEDYQWDKDHYKSCTDSTRKIKIDTYHVEGKHPSQ